MESGFEEEMRCPRFTTRRHSWVASKLKVRLGFLRNPQLDAVAAVERWLTRDFTAVENAS